MKKNTMIGFSLLACLMIPAWLAGQTISDSEQGMEMLRKFHSTLPTANKGFELMMAKDWEGAAHQFSCCLDVLPEHPNACFGMAFISNQTGDVPKALTWIEQAEKACASLQLVWENQKINGLKLSQEDEGRLYELATQNIGGNINNWSCTARARAYESKQLGLPSKDVMKAETSPFIVPAEFLALHGNLLFKQKRFAEAEAKYLEALAIEPAHERCLNNLVNIFFVTKRFALAREWLDKGAKLKVKMNPGLEKAVREAKETN
jgi:tetratricopeptide (TPR) repeat protein